MKVAKSVRFEMVMPAYLKVELKRLADEKGVALSELVKDALKDLVKASAK
jgi:hypothetical protein